MLFMTGQDHQERTHSDSWFAGAPHSSKFHLQTEKSPGLSLAPLQTILGTFSSLHTLLNTKGDASIL